MACDVRQAGGEAERLRALQRQHAQARPAAIGQSADEQADNSGRAAFSERGGAAWKSAHRRPAKRRSFHCAVLP